MRSPIAAVRSRARHRGKTSAALRAVCDELTHALVKMTAECDELTHTLVKMTSEKERLHLERNRLQADFDAAAIDYSGALYDKQQVEQRLAALEAGAA